MSNWSLTRIPVISVKMISVIVGLLPGYCPSYSENTTGGVCVDVTCWRGVPSRFVPQRLQLLDDPTEHHVFCLAHIKCPVLLQRVTRCNLSWPLLWLVVKLTHILIHNVCLVFVVSSRRTTKWQRSVDGRKSLHKVELLHAATENK